MKLAGALHHVAVVLSLVVAQKKRLVGEVAVQKMADQVEVVLMTLEVEVAVVLLHRKPAPLLVVAVSKVVWMSSEAVACALERL